MEGYLGATQTTLARLASICSGARIEFMPADPVPSVYGQLYYQQHSSSDEINATIDPIFKANATLSSPKYLSRA